MGAGHKAKKIAFIAVKVAAKVAAVRGVVGQVGGGSDGLSAQAAWHASPHVGRGKEQSACSVRAPCYYSSWPCCTPPTCLQVYAVALYVEAAKAAKELGVRDRCGAVNWVGGWSLVA